MPEAMVDGPVNTTTSHPMLQRVLKLIDSYWAEIDDEFYYEIESQRDWLQMFRPLRRASKLLLAQFPASDSPVFGVTVQDCKGYVDKQLYNALVALKNESANPVDMIFDARSCLARTRTMLGELSVAAPITAVDSVIEWTRVPQGAVWEESFAEYRDLLNKLDDHVMKVAENTDPHALSKEILDDNDPRIPVCQYSRKSYLFRACIVAVFPGRLPRDVEDKMLEIHRIAVEKCGLQGKIKKHTVGRLDKLAGRIDD